jgi:hypothetical protein
MLMMPPQRGSSRPLMAAPEDHRCEATAAPQRPDLTVLLWCYAAAVALALFVAHAPV